MAGEDYFIFGGNTGLTYEELKQRRAVAQALAARQKGYPKNIGEGLTYLGESIGEAGLNWRLRMAEEAQRKVDAEKAAKAGGTSSYQTPPKQGGTQAAPQQAPQQAPGAAPKTSAPLPPPVTSDIRTYPTVASTGAPTEGDDPNATVGDRFSVFGGGGSGGGSMFFGDGGASAPMVPPTVPNTKFFDPNMPAPNIDDRVRAPQPTLSTPASPDVAPFTPLPAGKTFSNVLPPVGAATNEFTQPPTPVPQGYPQDRPAAPQASGGAAPILASVSPGDTANAYRTAIGGMETGGVRDPYTKVVDTGKGDFVYGRYGIAGKNIPQWTEQALGRRMSPQEFLNNPQAQDATFDHRFGNYVDKYGPNGAARAWFAGERGMQNPNATDRFGRLNVAQYGREFENRLATAGGGGGATGTQGQNSPTGVTMDSGTDKDVTGTGRDSVVQALLDQSGGAGLEVPQVNPTQAGEEAPPTTSTSAALISGARGSRRSPGVMLASLPPTGTMSDAPPVGAEPPPVGSTAEVKQQNPAIITDEIKPIPVQTQRFTVSGMDTPVKAPVTGPVAQAPGAAPAQAEQRNGVRDLPNLAPSQTPIPPASQQMMKDPGPEPKRPEIIGLSDRARAMWSLMHDPYVSDSRKEWAKGQFDIEEKFRTKMNEDANNDYIHQREVWQKDYDAKQKFERESRDRDIDQLTKRLAIEKAQREELLGPIEKRIKEADADLKEAERLRQPDLADKLKKEIQKLGDEHANALKTLAEYKYFESRGAQYRSRYDPATQTFGPLELVPGSPKPKDDPFTESQTKAIEFSTRVRPDLDRADNEMQYGKALTDRQQYYLYHYLPEGIGNSMVSQEYRSAAGALGNSMSAMLTKLSGSAVTPSEALRNYPLFTPQPGDTDRDLLEKARRRRDMLNGIEAAAGPEARKAIWEAVKANNSERVAQELSAVEAKKPPVTVTGPNDPVITTLSPGRQLKLPDGSIRYVPQRQR